MVIYGKLVGKYSSPMDPSLEMVNGLRLYFLVYETITRKLGKSNASSFVAGGCAGGRSDISAQTWEVGEHIYNITI